MSVVVSALLCLYLLCPSLINVSQQLKSPDLGEDLKPVMAYLSQNRLKSDQIYVYYATGPAFKYYAPYFSLGRNDYVVGKYSRDDPTGYLSDIDRMVGNKRVWFVFSHNCLWCKVNEEAYFLEYLDKLGVKKDEFIAHGAGVYLYDLRPR